MILAHAFAQLLADRGLVTFNPDGGGGDCYAEQMPDQPDEMVGVFADPGEYPLAGHRHRDFNVQVRLRGAAYGQVATKERGVAIIDALHDSRGVVLADGRKALSIDATHSEPLGIGLDSNDRPEYVCRFALWVIPGS